MRFRSATWLAWTVGLLLLGGCCYSVREEVDREICDLATHPLDPQPQVEAAPKQMPPAQGKTANDRSANLFAGLAASGQVDASVQPAVAQAGVTQEPGAPSHDTHEPPDLR